MSDKILLLKEVNKKLDAEQDSTAYFIDRSCSYRKIIDKFIEGDSNAN